MGTRADDKSNQSRLDTHRQEKKRGNRQRAEELPPSRWRESRRLNVHILLLESRQEELLEVVEKMAVFRVGESGVGTLEGFIRRLFQEDDAALFEIQILRHRIRDGA